jgi:hypothetical protein
MEIACKMFNKKPPHVLWYLGMQWDLFEHYEYIATHVLGKMFSQHKEKGGLK